MECHTYHVSQCCFFHIFTKLDASQTWSQIRLEPSMRSVGTLSCWSWWGLGGRRLCPDWWLGLCLFTLVCIIWYCITKSYLDFKYQKIFTKGSLLVLRELANRLYKPFRVSMLIWFPFHNHVLFLVVSFSKRCFGLIL